MSEDRPPGVLEEWVPATSDAPPAHGREAPRAPGPEAFVFRRWKAALGRAASHIGPLALTVFLTAGCGDSPTGPTSPIAEYVLASVDGEALPWTIFEDEGYKLEVASGTLELDAEFQFVIALVTRETVDLAVSEYVDSLRGTWVESAAGTLQFDSDQEDELFTGSWKGRKVTIPLQLDFYGGTLEFLRK